MKKYILLFVMFLSVLTLKGYSQTGNTNNSVIQSEKSKYIFCELIQQDYYWHEGPRTTTFLHFGNKPTYENRIEESRDVKLLNDGVDALNYMSRNGWDLMTKNARVITNGIETVYLLRKKAP